MSIGVVNFLCGTLFGVICALIVMWRCAKPLKDCYPTEKNPLTSQHKNILKRQDLQEKVRLMTIEYEFEVARKKLAEEKKNNDS
jgi:hypothetical protein